MNADAPYVDYFGYCEHGIACVSCAGEPYYGRCFEPAVARISWLKDRSDSMLVCAGHLLECQEEAGVT